MLNSAFYFQEAVDIASILYVVEDLTSTYYILNLFRRFINLLLIKFLFQFVSLQFQAFCCFSISNLTAIRLAVLTIYR